MPKGRDYPVRELRDQLKMTQAELAAAVGVSLGSVARWEGKTKKVKPTPLAIQQLERLAKRAGFSGEVAA